jgi:hypothetical protein
MSTKQTATAAMQAQAYTDWQVQALAMKIQNLEYRQQLDAKRAMRLKITVHVTVVTIGILVSYLVDPYLLPVITGVPSLLIEFADRVLKII